MRVKALYDFAAQPNTGELSIQVGEILTVTRQDVGEGWYEGSNARGEVGLFPAGYVEEEVAPNRPTSGTFQSPANQFSNNQQFTAQQGIFATQTSNYGVSPSNQDQNNTEYYEGDAWDDDWSDDESQTASDYTNQAVSNSYYHTNIPTHSMSLSTLNASNTNTNNKSVPVRKSYNRFSVFVKSGGEDYILGTKNKHVPSIHMINIIQDANSGRIMWAPIQDTYSCSISSFKKESKLKGLKSYIAYQVTPSFNNIQVSRRYKQFDWLHERLQDKFIGIPLPSLPDKQISNRYQEFFIEHRMRQLRLWVQRICRHPVLSQSDFWMHFLTCTEEKEWKNGKRRAEKDEFTNASFFYTIQPPNVPLDLNAIEKKSEYFNRFIAKMDDSVKHMFLVAQDQTRKYSSNYKRESLKVANSFKMLASAFDISGQEEKSLLNAIKGTCTAYESIADLYEKQPAQDFQPLSDVLHEYKGIMTSWPEILDLHKGALGRKKEHIKLKEDGKIDANTCESVSSRADTVSYAVLAEINHFHDERVKDFKDVISHFLQEQINFHEKIVNQLKEAQQKFEYV